ncbi:AAA family ATPase [Alteraurantiacibacter aquimixticola]|uniref:AAA family ATPase n=1 Tax=Alteraurantiacibacter aquimixticola TaxID=2489173 RepID=A0A4T3EZJ2_9SPHN|nr:AAA family ATPase [Alteraurantiacibacter aquimixticola]TIX50054.1 AAA family ATPase [Alteraurantiacibacter aquimixticola]
MTMVGHEAAWAEWRAALSGPRMHHGWILGGKRGLGKASFALAAARELVAEPGAPTMAGEHPDIITLTHLPIKGDEKKKEEGKPYQLRRNITVDQVREMQARLTTRPTLGSRRVIIIDPADDLEKGASNALLKSLEEPPAGTYFLLVTHRPGRLLPTIRSRCRVLRFPQLADEEIDRVLAREMPEADAATRAAAVAASGGSPGAALEFVELDLGKLHALMEEIAEQGDPAFTLRGRLADAMGARPDRQRQLAVVELARAVVTRKMESVPRSAIPALADAHADLARLVTQVPTYNFDPGLLVMEIGTLLASLAASREAANG